jgi:hypothetical protein
VDERITDVVTGGRYVSGAVRGESICVTPNVIAPSLDAGSRVNVVSVARRNLRPEVPNSRFNACSTVSDPLTAGASML